MSYDTQNSVQDHAFMCLYEMRQLVSNVCGREAENTNTTYIPTGYDFGRNDGKGKTQIHADIVRLRRDLLNLDMMVGGAK